MKRINILRVPSYKSAATWRPAPTKLSYIAKNGTCKPFMVVLPRSKGPRQISERSIFIISKMERSLICSSRREWNIRPHLLRGNWWQKFRDVTGPCRLIDGLQFGKGKMAVVEPIKATTTLATYDEDFRIQAAGKRLHSLRAGTCLWRQHACRRSQPNGIAAAPLPALRLQVLNLASQKQQKKHIPKRRGMSVDFAGKLGLERSHQLLSFSHIPSHVGHFYRFFIWGFRKVVGLPNNHGRFPTKNDDFGVWNGGTTI